ncbi:MAG: 2-amino-4-hydroxy-6-hydroxymethyldihydropteridine diphosphokinase [Paludibacteraceae bacterium]|jgi:2-amino-4-hydroxy-6-hydroxymethyldihydropteridine diphosphokinase|nr:2-amino-4-hydroxy-6-hydroxymethyldihydropteridine diphosphokinase [Paludibacteraceae bacterium]MBR5470050.1 2-amino-4-hydroxy-6-hydroxymethyldihydropteridine diphosphokinase [Paludibacteraceae bacterium]
MATTVYFSLGTNLGEKERNIKEALLAINKNIGEVIHCSNPYENSAWGFTSENLFLNIAVEVKTILSAQQVLNEITHIEKKIGRTTKTKNGIYNDRVIDIDILFFGSEIIDDENLKIPHPLLTQRIFVLKPLCEIAPSFIHPTLKKNIQELYNTLKSI